MRVASNEGGRLVMPRKPAVSRSSEPVLRTRLRIVCGAEDAFGPGKAQLLSEVHQTGSLSQAAKALKMSYMKAWTLVQAMNKHFVEPLVKLSRGGSHGGGARLTPTGEEVLRSYQQLREKVEQAAEGNHWKKIKELLRAV